MEKKAKKLMGRPKKDADEVLCHNLSRVRLNNKQVEKLQSLADKAGLTVADFVRRRLGL